MNRKYVVVLSQEQREYLQRVISCGTSPARAIRRAQILLKSDTSSQGPAWSYQKIRDYPRVLDGEGEALKWLS